MQYGSHCIREGRFWRMCRSVFLRSGVIFFRFALLKVQEQVESFKDRVKSFRILLVRQGGSMV